MSLSPVPAIFNRQLLRKRLLRASPGQSVDNFLLQRIAEDIASRLGLIKRDFQLCAVFGDHIDHLAPALENLPNIGRLITLGDTVSEALSQSHIIATEERLPLASESINLAISPMTLQFANDLPGALIQLKRSLKPDGLFIAAFLGGDTLIELRDALLSAESDIRGGAAPRIHPRVDIRDLGTLLQRAGFAIPVVDSDRISVTYRSATHLMHDLRALGLTSILNQGTDTSLNRRIIARLEEVYKDRYPAPGNRISATFEIIYLTGWAPHESQQRPLQPGSAKTRLADALKTKEISISDDDGK